MDSRASWLVLVFGSLFCSGPRDEAPEVAPGNASSVQSINDVRLGVEEVASGRAALQIRLTAPPVEGAANQALVGFLAGSLRLRRGDISIRSGATARLKVLHLAGDSTLITAKLAEWIAMRPP